MDELHDTINAYVWKVICDGFLLRFSAEGIFFSWASIYKPPMIMTINIIWQTQIVYSDQEQYWVLYSITLQINASSWPNTQPIHYDAMTWGHLPYYFPLCEEHPPMTGGFPHKGTVIQSFYIFFVNSLNQLLKKQWGCCWFRML